MLSYGIVRPFLRSTKSLNLATLDFLCVAEQAERNDNAAVLNINKGILEEDATKTQHHLQSRYDIETYKQLL